MTAGIGRVENGKVRPLRKVNYLYNRVILIPGGGGGGGGLLFFPFFLPFSPICLFSHILVLLVGFLLVWARLKF